MVSQSHKGTLYMIDCIVKDYDSIPRSWRDDLIRHVQPEQLQVFLIAKLVLLNQVVLNCFIESCKV